MFQHKLFTTGSHGGVTVEGVKLLVPLLAIVAAAGTASPAAAREIRAAGPVGALAASGAEVAYTAAHRSGCHEVRVWDTRDRGVRRYASHCFASTSTGSGIAAVAVASGRALWVTYTGGNTREWSLWTKTRTSTGRRIAFASREADGPAPFVLGRASTSRLGEMLPYAFDATVIALRPNGARRFSWTAAARVVDLSARDGELAVATADGVVTVLDAGGRVLGRHGFGAGLGAVELVGNGVLAQVGRTLDLRRGSERRVFRLAAGARLGGATSSTAYVVTAGAAHAYPFDGGGRRLAAAIHVRSDGSRVVLASGRRVAFVAG